jgi:drug/metabolite transporter (DMT)-like permease
MTQKNTARVIAAGFFLGWLGILYAGADDPPPPGFVLILLADLVAAVLVYLRAPTYMGWSRTRRKNRLFLASLDGLAAGLVLALVAILLPGGGEPSVQPAAIDHVIWFAVLGGVGAANTILIYGLSAYLSKKTNS